MRIGQPNQQRHNLKVHRAWTLLLGLLASPTPKSLGPKVNPGQAQSQGLGYTEPPLYLPIGLEQRAKMTP